MEKNKINERLINEAISLLDIHLEDSPSEIGIVLEHKNYARVFVALGIMYNKGGRYTRYQLAKYSGVSRSNLTKYVDYFIQQKFIKIENNPRFSRRMSVIKPLPNKNWGSLFKIAYRTIRDIIKKKCDK